MERRHRRGFGAVMDQYRVQLTVDMNAESPAQAAEYVAEMADGWSYVVTNLLTGQRTFVHLSNNKDPIVEPYALENDEDFGA